jgi:hypothetical protein
LLAIVLKVAGVGSAGFSVGRVFYGATTRGLTLWKKASGFSLKFLSGTKTNDSETDKFNCIKPWISWLIQLQQFGSSLHTFRHSFEGDIIT